VLVTRQDLTPGYQAVQPMHASHLFQATYPRIYRWWYNYHKHIALLAVPNELALLALFEKAEHARLKCVLFKEPDIGNEATAIAIEPHEKAYKMVSSLPLALKEYTDIEVSRVVV